MINLSYPLSFFLLISLPCMVYPQHQKRFHVDFYYVDVLNGNDSSQGRSPNTAWKTLQNLNTTIFQPGTIISLKRGCVWGETLQITTSGTQEQPIIYTSYGSSELAQPVIDAELVRNNCVYHYGKNFVTYRDLSFKNATGNGDVRIIYSSGVVVDGCTFLVTGHGGVFIENSNNCIIRSNTITSPEGDLDVQTDGIYSQRNSDNIYEKNNITLNNCNVLQHIDGIQSYIDNNLIIRNNYIFQQNSKTNSQGIYTTTGSGVHTYFNNIVYCPNTVASVMGFKNLTTGTASLRAYHNTLIGMGANILAISGDPSPVVKNNILVALGTLYGVLTIDSTCLNPTDINYNLYFNGGSTGVVTYRGTVLTFTQWKELGFESAGVFGDPVFKSDFSLSSGSPAINKGYQVGTICAYDKAGIVRPQMGVVDLGAYESFYAGKIEEKETSPLEFSLSQNYPNPFNPSTTIKFTLSEASKISLKVYDLLGNEIADLADGSRGQGIYEVTFNGEGLASGIYIYILKAGSFTETRKMSLLK